MFEEKVLGKSQDLRLFARLYPYIRPYRRLLLAALGLMVLATLFELAIPYVTKIAIDRYIVPREIAGSASGKSAERRYLVVDPSDQQANIIVEQHSELFETTDGAARIPYENLSRLPAKEIVYLRRDDLKGVALTALFLLGLVVLSFGVNFSQVMMMEYAGQQIMHDLRMSLFGHIQGLSIRFFTRNPIGRLVTRVTNDVQNMQEMFNSVLIFVIKDFFLLAGITLVLLAIDWRLTLIVYAIFPLVFYAAFRFAGSAREAFRTLRIKVAEINSRFSETIGGIQVIQLFNREKANYEKFKVLNHENYIAGMRQINVFALFMPFVEMMSSVALAMVIYYGGHSLLAERITLGSLVVFISYIRMFFRPLRDIAEKYNVTQNALSSAERMFLILDETDRIPEPDAHERIAIPGELKSLAFEAVSFSYVPGENVLHQLSFVLEAGKTTAIVGPTGAGKTSIINLICRFYDPDAGRILLNGIDIRKFSAAELRSRIALVTQDPFLFSGSIRENILPADQSMSAGEIDTILSQSMSRSFIRQMENGLDAQLSEHGASLSSGQRQLISIARALASDPELIIFDEATSYIDSNTEDQIQKALLNISRLRTMLVIAHRLSTARIADRIMVIHDGKIVESGSHAHLMARKGYYFRLNQFQINPDGI